MNDKDGKLKFGDYRLDFHEGPIYVAEVESHPTNGRYMWVSVAKPGTMIRGRSPERDRPKDLAQKNKATLPP